MKKNPSTITSLTSDATNNMKGKDSTVTFTCSVDSRPPSLISWSRSQQGEQLYSGSQYTIPKASCQHTDNYTCTASNNIGQPVSKTIPFYVRYAPILDPNQETKTSISAILGETGVLTIHVLACPLPVYTWYYQLKGGSEKLVTDFRTRQEDAGLLSTLTIQEVTQDDEGKYIVYVNNDHGTKSIVFNLDVVESYKFVIYLLACVLGTAVLTYIIIVIIQSLKKNKCNKTEGDQTVIADTTAPYNIPLPAIPGDTTTDCYLTAINTGEETQYEELNEQAIDEQDNNPTYSDDTTKPGGKLNPILTPPNEYLTIIDTDEDLDMETDRK